MSHNVRQIRRKCLCEYTRPLLTYFLRQHDTGMFHIIPFLESLSDTTVFLDL